MFGYTGTSFASGRQSDKTDAMKHALAEMVALGTDPKQVGAGQARSVLYLLSAQHLRRLRGNQDSTILNIGKQTISSFLSQWGAGAKHLRDDLVKEYKAKYQEMAIGMSESSDSKQWVKNNILHYQPVFATDEKGVKTDAMIESMKKVEMPDNVAASWVEGLEGLVA